MKAPGISEVLPPHARLWMELGAGPTGHSFFWNDDIVPAWLVDKYKHNPELQAYPETPQAYKALGEWLGVSPLKVQYAITSGLSRELDKAVTTIERPSGDARDLLIVGRLKQREPSGFASESVQSLMDLKYKYDTIKELAESETDEDKKAAMESQIAAMAPLAEGANLVDKVWQVAKDNRAAGDNEGYRRVKKIMVGLGRDILGVPPLPGYPDPWNSWDDMPDDVKEAVGKYVTARSETAILSHGQPERKKKDGKFTEPEADFNERTAKWQAKRQAALAWLREHKDSPAVQDALKETFGKPYTSLWKGDKPHAEKVRAKKLKAEFGG
jgi:hypothetical protein